MFRRINTLVEIVKKNIYLFITPFFPCDGRHYGSYSYDFIQALKRNSDFNVLVFVPGRGLDYDFNGCHVYRFATRCIPSGILPMAFSRWNQRSFLRKLDSVASEEAFSIDDVKVCHCNTLPFAIYSVAVKRLNMKCKTILHHHDLASIGLRIGVFRHIWIHKVVSYIWLRRLAALIDLHVFISSACRNSFLSFPDTSWSVYSDYRKLSKGMAFFRPPKIKDSIILWNGVDLSLFNANGKKKSSDAFVVGCIGNFIEVKDHLSLVKAIHHISSRIPGLRLEFLGDNGYARYRDPVKKYINDNKLEGVVSILPHVDHTALPDVYRNWDLFVLPSWFEGLGCVYLEAFACGTPFIGCVGQGIEDCINPSEAQYWLASPKDPVALSEKIFDYYTTRRTQSITGPIDIDEIVRKFIDKIEDVTV